MTDTAIWDLDDWSLDVAITPEIITSYQCQAAEE